MGDLCISEFFGSALGRLMLDESGSNAIEYAMIGAMISIAFIVGARAIGSNVSDLFSNVNSGFST